MMFQSILLKVQQWPTRFFDAIFVRPLMEFPSFFVLSFLYLPVTCFLAASMWNGTIPGIFGGLVTLGVIPGTLSVLQGLLVGWLLWIGINVVGGQKYPGLEEVGVLKILGVWSRNLLDYMGGFISGVVLAALIAASFAIALSICWNPLVEMFSLTAVKLGLLPDSLSYWDAFRLSFMFCFFPAWAFSVRNVRK